MTRIANVLRLAVIIAVFAAIAFAGYWAATGGRWFIVRTPSMGQAAPVGTLLWVRPSDHIHVGDMITFRPPEVASTYSHRVYAIAADGAITTKGDANNAPDPWRITRSDIVGKVVARWWGIGWLVRAAPILIIGWALLWLLSGRFVGRRWVLPTRIFGASTVVSVALYILRPLVGAQQIALLPTSPGVEASYVSTGLLPLRLSAAGGEQVRLVSGQTGTVRSSLASADGHFGVSLVPDLAWWWWLVLAAICFLPAMCNSMLDRHRRRHRRRHRARPA